MDKIAMLIDNGSVSSRPKQGFRFDKVAAKFCEYAKRKGRKHRKSFVINDAPVAQLDRASGYEPTRRKTISRFGGVAYNQTPLPLQVPQMNLS
jgi:hypothetical protein